MTRARAVEILKSTLAYDSDFAEAKQMAIEALEQEPTAEYSSDLISRQDAMNELKEMQDYISYKIFCAENNPTEYAEDYIRNMEQQSVGIAHVEHRILELPSAQPFTEEQIQTMQELEAAQVEKAYELGKADRPKWIPCSERLPENGEKVLCQTITKKGQINMVIGFYDFERWCCGMNSNVIAWMPLPEAYREDGGKE